MLQVFIVVFREVIEIALIVGMLTAATKGIDNRGRYITFGLIFGTIGAIVLAFAMDSISQMMDGDGQEVFSGVVLMSAAALITWTVIWMQKHAKTLSGELKNLASSVKLGDKSIISLFLVTALAVLREGAEIVLFTYGYYLSGLSFFQLSLGLVCGILCGALCGIALFYGMMKLFGKYFFKITTWILIFLSCAIFSQGVGYLVNVEVVPAIIDPIWDSSNILLQSSFVGKILNIFIGYVDQPSATVLIAYLLNLTVLLVGLKVTKVEVNRNERH